MFEGKRQNLYGKKEKEVKDMNVFEKEMFKQEHHTFSGNGADKLTTTGNPFVDDFASLGRYKQPRPLEEVFATMANLWSIDPITCLKETVYLRLITRDTKLFTGTKLQIQRGQGLKSEFWHRLMWLATNHPNTFKKNLDIFICAGSWDDLFELMRIDLSYVHGGNPYKRALDWNFLLRFICEGLQNPEQSELVKKYLPQIKAAKYCTTARSQQNNYIAKAIANKIFDGEKQERYAAYRRLKASGTAHEWQKLLSRKDFSKIDFGKIAGRALNLLTNSKFLANHGLEEEFCKWVMSQDTAKFTGFVYELFSKPVTKRYQQELLNKQFNGLIETAKQNMNCASNFIVCLDTSGSMTSTASGTNMTSLHVAKSMALYFSHLLEGRFKNTFLEFESKVYLHNWVGETPYEQFTKTRTSGWCGSTNFLAVADTLVDLKRKGYQESEFPTGVLCISDGEFDNAYTYNVGNRFDRDLPNASALRATTFELFKKRLIEGGFSQEFVDNFKMVLWDIPNGYYGRKESCFEGLADQSNFFYMSGFDPSGIAFLTGKQLPEKKEEAPKNAEELFQAAMSQELLGMLRI